jgi:hypothetical protein
MKKVIGILLIILSLYLGYVGITKFSNSGQSVDIVGIEISTENNHKKSTAYLYIGLALVSFVGGGFLTKNGKPT